MHNQQTIKKNPSNSRRGFTLVEMVVASFITLIGLVGIHNLLFWIMFSTAESGRGTQAAAVAQDKMEEIIGAGFSSSVSGQDSTLDFQRFWTVGASANGDQRITVRVTWSDIKNQPHELTVKSILADDRISASGLPFTSPSS